MTSPADDSVRSDCRAVLGKGRERLLSSLRGSRILVAGGTGFVGTWLTETIACLNDEYDYSVSVVLVSRHCERMRLIAPHLARRSEVSLVESDVRDLVDSPHADYLINAAGTPDSRAHASDPIGTIDTIATGATTLLEAAYAADGLAGLLHLSSGLIYGEQPLGLPEIPEDWAGGPRCDTVMAAYPEAKRCAEAQCAAWRTQYKLPIITARPFAFVGPYQGLDKPWAVNNFLRDALAGGPIRILGDGDTVRSYMYGSDMAFWLLRMLAAGVPGNAYNLGSPHPIRLEDLADTISTSVSPKVQVVSRTGGERAPSRFVPDITKAREALGLDVTVSLEEALLRTLAWHRCRAASGESL
jgi:nucleoside-diphosphate-sugar epimerase